MCNLVVKHPPVSSLRLTKAALNSDIISFRPSILNNSALFGCISSFTVLVYMVLVFCQDVFCFGVGKLISINMSNQPEYKKRSNYRIMREGGKMVETWEEVNGEGRKVNKKEEGGIVTEESE